MPRFAILRHEPGPQSKRPLHWDLLLERDDTLVTWALLEEPGAGRVVQAERLPDHRTAYLDYEGPVSNGRGSVQRWDAGDFQIHNASDTHWDLALRGRRLNCRLDIVTDTARPQRWTATFKN